MAKLKIEYYLDRCVGNKQCLKNDPKTFGFSDGRAVLKGAAKEKGVFFLEKEFSAHEANNAINAGKSCPVNAISVTDVETGKNLVSSAVTFSRNLRELGAKYDDAKEFVLDPAGYFLIKIDKKKRVIEVGFCKKRNIIEVTVTGKKAIDIYMSILREKLVERPDHAAYLGRELAKAELALKYDLEYVQDDELWIK